MSTTKRTPVTARIVSMMLICFSAASLAGCSQDFASVDDVYVPRATDERFPIEVVDMPVKLSVSAESGKLRPQDVNRLSAFANAARAGRTSPVSVTYPAGSARARAVSQQAASVLIQQGVPRSKIHTVSYKGKSDIVSLSFTRRVAATKECGDWSKNLGVNNDNEPGPDFGCALQNNLAAMASNPEDFERPRAIGPTQASGQMTAMENYNTGEWTVPVEMPDVSEISQN